MNWRNYEKFIHEKVQDAKYNLEQAEKKVKEARAVYLSVLREKDSFENAIEELIGKDGE